jgi:hypothetical protein
MLAENDDLPGKIRTIRPSLPPQVMQLINAVISSSEGESPTALARRLRKINTDWEEEAWSLPLRAVALVLADLLDQGWSVLPVKDTIELRPPGLLLDDETVERAKDRIRRSLHVARMRQLEEPGVKHFLQRMHRVVPRVCGPSSIADLIDSGPELAALLREVAKLPAEARAGPLASTINPTIQVCDEDAKCALSGLRLIDIWRYFRHTWSLEYRSTPGRKLPLLIRNVARPGWPVIGIAMLTSPVVRARPRDEWIGWTQEAFVRAIERERIPARDALRALSERLNKSIFDLRTDDLATTEELSSPTERTVWRVEQRAAGAERTRARVLQEFYAGIRELNEEIRSQPDPARNSLKDLDLRSLSEDPLFVRKRADTLSRLLHAKLIFIESQCLNTNGSPLACLLSHPKGERALSIALQEVRKSGLSSQVVDLSVCGAVAPYNVLVSGKLVALLMASTETLTAYRQRYEGKPSVISSQMAGRLICRAAELKVVTTTSLYGNGSSQYNRLRMLRSDHPGLAQDIIWVRLARTMGFGTHHLSSATLDALRKVSEAVHGARRINNRFGEGSSARMRQTREGLEALGIETNAVLNHATPRLIYGCEVHKDAIAELIGIGTQTRSTGSSANDIADAWRQRWLAGRITQPDILDRLAQLGSTTIQRSLQVPAMNEQLDLLFDSLEVCSPARSRNDH